MVRILTGIISIYDTEITSLFEHDSRSTKLDSTDANTNNKKLDSTDVNTKSDYWHERGCAPS